MEVVDPIEPTLNLVLPPRSFERYDGSNDALFYAAPRFVTHIDDAAVAAVTRLYRELLPSGGAILDLMSSWVSHLPPEVDYRRVGGLGMNRAELAANPRLHDAVVQDLNRASTLPFADAEFDAATICVSVQYLTQPIIVFREVGRVLRPGAPLIVTYSNRCFPSKAVAIWTALNDQGHGELVKHYFAATHVFAPAEVLDRSPNPGRSDPLYAVLGRRLPTHDQLTGA
jgi:SAM-dependent methyltransferase